MKFYSRLFSAGKDIYFEIALTGRLPANSFALTISDCVKIVLCAGGRRYEIYNGIVSDFLWRLNLVLTWALNGELELQGGQDPARDWNIFQEKRIHRQPHNEELAQQCYNHQLSKDIASAAASWVYTKNGNIFISVAPVHRAKQNEISIAENAQDSFDQFLKNYAALAVFKLPRNLAQKWVRFAKKSWHTLANERKSKYKKNMKGRVVHNLKRLQRKAAR